MPTLVICALSDQHGSAIIKKGVVPFSRVIGPYGMGCDFQDLFVVYLCHILEKEVEVDSTDVSVKECFGTTKSKACDS